MKQLRTPIILFTIATFAACTDNYQTANTLLDGIKQHKKSFDSLGTIPKYQTAVKEALIDQASGVQIKWGKEPDYTISPQYIEQLSAGGNVARAEALKELNTHLTAVVACKNRFLEVLDNVSDKEKKMELLKRYDRVYVMEIEK